MAELDVSTRLAFDRTRGSYDRTMMSWIRTSTSLISFGFAIFKFFQLEVGAGRKDGYLVGASEFAILMVCIGLLSLLLGVLEYRQNMRSLRAQVPDLPRSRTGILAGLICIMGILALIMVILRK